MPGYRVDLNAVASVLDKRVYKVSDVKDRLVKVAFDVCRFVDQEPDKLWQIHNGSDGDYIVAMYEDDEKIATASTSPWEVSSQGDGLNIFYKKEHLGKISAASVGFEQKDMDMARSYLPKALASNKELVRGFLTSLGKNQKDVIIAKYPELV